jgi:hypothetical protein
MSSEEPRADELLDAHDAASLGAVRELFDRIDPVPAMLGDRVKFALTVRALEAEIADLQRLPAEGAGVRSLDYARAQTVTFTTDNLTAMVTITPLGADTVRIDGWVTGGQVEVELRERSRSSIVDTDDDGRFVFERVPRGLAQFVLRPRGGSHTRAVITPSIEL